ncbi:alpha/beta fold hydrolase [Aurantimonas sp. VKM B-3413]|uniref:alpha/beta fold hydrolase n=1 Tax=Aurantimonas sp. VKM B-3413 TaxID=2779401 RepID=UPI001E32CC9C|nr:alpha/beta fold hydrolase [Aurantimonas sp. VKM B-3413]MCB8838521.1 alpha/beta hydrolase [Aurantimonas sp. VKM B-3413]
MKSTSIVLVPGLLCTGELYRHQIEALGADCLIADTLQDATITAMAERLLAEAPRRFVLCGLSMGGYVALEVMRLAPDRVFGLALMATSARPDTPEQTEARRRLIAFAARAGIAAVGDVLADRLFAPEAARDPVLRALTVTMAEAVGIQAFIRQQEAIIARRDQTDLLSGVAAPTEVLAGILDQIIDPARSREMAAAIPGAHLTMIEGGGHLVTLEAPDPATAALRRLVAAAS